MAQTEKKAPDWERIEADYRAGVLSVREIASANGVSHVAISKRAKKEGWERDLAAKIKAKADALVTTRAVTKEVTSQKAVTDRAIVEANAEVIANIRLAHRSDIRRARDLCMKLLQELEWQTGDLGLLEQLADLLNSDEEGSQDKRMELFSRVLSMPGRIDGMKKLAETLKNLVGIEREAYGIAEATKIDLSNSDGSLSQKGRSLSDFYEDAGVSAQSGAV
jgi:hypothetical protein